jgi:pilus assembly protein Flp/PilA
MNIILREEEFMLTTWRYLKLRYLNEKGQGMVEYAVVVAVVIAIGVVLAKSDSGIATTISEVYKSVFDKAKNIGATTGNG